MPHLQCVMVKSHNARPPACTTHCMPSTTQLMRYTIQDISHKSIAMMLIFDDVSDVEYAFVVVFCPHNLRIHSCSACIRKSNTTTHNSAKHFRSSSCSECVNKTHQGQGGVTSGHNSTPRIRQDEYKRKRAARQKRIAAVERRFHGFSCIVKCWL